MESLYNPDLMPEAPRIKETFVARQNVVDERVSLIKISPMEQEQQAVSLAAGMGKTNVLLMCCLRYRTAT